MLSSDPYMAKKEAYKEAYKEAFSLPDLIHPDDIQEGAEDWSEISDETLEQEIAECVSIAHSEGQHDGLIRELAVMFWRDSLPRVPMDDLVFDDEETAVRNGYWPYAMDKWQCEEILFECDLPGDCEREAAEVVMAGVADKLHPREGCNPDRV